MMISVSEAKSIIAQSVSSLHQITVPLDQAIGYTLAQDVYAQVDVPFYPQSSMDGYAFRHESLIQGLSLKVIGKIQAGSDAQLTLNIGEAVRIFTGAPVPESADTVVMQEKVILDGEYIFLESSIEKGLNVRLQGSEIKKGSLGLSAGHVITPSGIGFLASIGLQEVNVIAKPRVSIIVTGNELQEIGQPLSYGQVYESNSHTVVAALTQMGISDIQLYRVKDNLKDLVKDLDTALNTSDLVLLTGGISVGEYDYVSEATKICGITQVFHKIKQKPGKPIFFGMKGEKVIFGLPGNPASVLTCYYQYVTLALDKLSGTNLTPLQLEATINLSYTKPAGLTHFLKGSFDGKSVIPLEGQESYKLNSFARANCLIEIPENTTTILSGELVKIHLI
jgi:molybdopterin molybdotransferase